MDISFYCDSCGQHILIDQEEVGASVDCPACRYKLIVPATSQSLIAKVPMSNKTKAILDVGLSDVIDLVSNEPKIEPAPPPMTEIPVSQTAIINGEKICPFCAESIKFEASVCRFCGLELATGRLAGSKANSEPETIYTQTGEQPTQKKTSAGASLFGITIGVVVFLGGIMIFQDQIMIEHNLLLLMFCGVAGFVATKVMTAIAGL